MRRLWPLTARGTGAALLAVACFIIAAEAGIAELVYFGLLLVSVLAVSVASLYLTRHSETVSRALTPDVATVGREARVHVRVGVRTALPTAPGTWRDTVPRGLTATAQGVFPALGSGLRGSGRTVEFSYPVTGARRGVHPLGPLQVTSTDPFGLAWRTTVFGERDRVTVAPAVIDLPALAGLAGDAGGSLHTAHSQLGQGADNLIARPYMPGDSMRRIHWRATAHRDELMVRQEEQESTPEATVVFDRGVLRFSPEAMQAPGADPGFETAVSACVSVVSRLVRDGFSVEVVDSDGTLLAERIDGGDASQVEAVVYQFATLTARRDDHLAAAARLFSGVMTGPVVLIAGRLDPADADVIASIAHHSTFAVLLAVAPVADALERATDFGWHAAPIAADADLASSWAGAADRGVSHALG